MRGTNVAAIYVLWLREMKRFSRSKSRVASTLALPFLFLVGFWFGFRSIQLPGTGGDIDYLQFLVPGIVGMTMLFAASFGGISVIFDRQFGFLKEILVTPVDRVSIALGRVAGSTTTAVIQGVLLLGISILIGATFIGLGLAFASRVNDFQAFNLVFNFVLVPLLFLSGALYPVSNLPTVVRYVTYVNPLTYGVDGLRGVLVGASTFSPLLDFVVMGGFAIVFVVLGAYSFEGSDAV